MRYLTRILAFLAIFLASIEMGLSSSAPAHAYLTNCTGSTLANTGWVRCTGSNIGGLNIVRAKVRCLDVNSLGAIWVYGPWVNKNVNSIGYCPGSYSVAWYTNWQLL